MVRWFSRCGPAVRQHRAYEASECCTEELIYLSLWFRGHRAFVPTILSWRVNDCICLGTRDLRRLRIGRSIRKLAPGGYSQFSPIERFILTDVVFIIQVACLSPHRGLKRLAHLCQSSKGMPLPAMIDRIVPSGSVLPWWSATMTCFPVAGFLHF